MDERNPRHMARNRRPHCPVDIRGVLGVTVWLMSDGELARLEVLRDLDQKRLTTPAAAQTAGA
jgi:hypothetical protein